MKFLAQRTKYSGKLNLRIRSLTTKSLCRARYKNDLRKRGKSNGEMVIGVLCAKTRKAEGPTEKLIQFNKL